MRRRLAYQINLKIFILAVAVIWTGIMAASWVWNVRQVKENTLEEALVQARVAYEKDIIYRRWNTMHGGVYARVTEETKPNPYLVNQPDRDVVTESGIRLTLINPAYMTRQANELTTREFAVRGHITSDNPLRPGNSPDEWESWALTTFREGVKEVSSVEYMGGEEYMRLMRPLVTEEGCLRCHEHQGYRTGDVRGGISVAVSMKALRGIEKRSLVNLSFVHLFLWVLGLTGHFLGTRQLVRSEKERRQAEEDTRRYAMDLEESNHLKDLFIDIMRHDLLNPTAVIKSYAGMLLEEETDPRKRGLVNNIDLVNMKLMEMIENASKYSRLEEMKSIECARQDINKIVKDSVLLATGQIEDLPVEIDYRAEGEFPARVNPMIGDVFLNLASNAVKYAADGKKIEIGILDNGDFWNVYVKDFGPGISDEDKEKIFTRFERLNKEGVKGTGLGLAIARRLVDLHAGRIWAEDNPAGGCVFFVSLPKMGPSQTG